jgi:outer membrane immunogenic protein
MRLKSSRATALTLGLFVSTALSGAAWSADVEPLAYDWTGLYVGGHVGYGWIDLRGSADSENAVPGEDFESIGAGRFDLDDDDFLAGFQAGLNYQIDRVVLGIEGDVSFTDFEDELSNTENDHVSFDTDFVATLRARAGLLVDDNFLLFATAGAAWTDTRFTYSANSAHGELDLDDVGLAVGGGAEYALDDRWSIKADALYMIFDDKRDTSNLTASSEEGDFIELEDLLVVRLGINFHL